MRLDVIRVALHLLSPTKERIAGSSGVAKRLERQGCAASAGAMTIFGPASHGADPLTSALPFSAAGGCAKKSF